MKIIEPNTSERMPFFQAAGVRQNAEELGERCWTKPENKARKEGCLTRIEEVDDVQHEESEEQRKQEEEE